MTPQNVSCPFSWLLNNTISRHNCLNGFPWSGHRHSCLSIRRNTDPRARTSIQHFTNKSLGRFVNQKTPWIRLHKCPTFLHELSGTDNVVGRLSNIAFKWLLAGVRLLRAMSHRFTFLLCLLHVPFLVVLVCSVCSCLLFWLCLVPCFACAAGFLFDYSWNSWASCVPSSRSTQNTTDAETRSPMVTGVLFAAKYLPGTSRPRETFL